MNRYVNFNLVIQTRFHFRFIGFNRFYNGIGFRLTPFFVLNLEMEMFCDYDFRFVVFDLFPRSLLSYETGKVLTGGTCIQ